VDFVDFFQRCSAGLAPGGMFFCKENICQQVGCRGCPRAVELQVALVLPVLCASPLANQPT
jgi:hypothetical protein